MSPAGRGSRAAGTAKTTAPSTDAQLRAVGSDMAHAVSTRVYMVSGGPAVLSAVWDVVGASGLGAGPHSSTLGGVACLGYPGRLVEVTATAVVPTGR